MLMDMAVIVINLMITMRKSSVGAVDCYSNANADVGDINGHNNDVVSDDVDDDED